MEHSDLSKKNSKGTGFYGSVIENADYLVDIEISKERKKRVRVDVEDSRWDKTYVSFLVDLENYMDAKFEEEDDEEDPIYASFLEHLKENGKGYMLLDSVEHGVKIPLVYEVETPKKKSPVTRLSSKTQKKSPQKYSSFADQVKTDSADTRKKYNTRACQGANILKKGSFDANKELKSTTGNSGFVNVVQIDPSIVIKKEMIRNCEPYNLRKMRSMVKADLQNSKTVKVEAEAEGGSLDEIHKKTSRNCEHYNLRRTRNVEAKTPLKPVPKNTKIADEVEANSSDEINKETSGTRHGYNMRKRSGLEADGHLKPGLKKCKIEKDLLEVIEVDANSLDEISRETSRTRSGYNLRKRSGLEADKLLKPGRKKCKVEKDLFRLNDGPPISCDGSIHRELKSGLPNSVFLNEKEGNPSQVIERNTLRTEGCANRELKSGLPNSVFLNEKEGDPSQVIERNTLRTEGCANKELKSGLSNSAFLNEKEGDPSQVIERNISRTKGCAKRELKSGLPNSVFLNEKEGDPSQVIERNTLRTEDCANRELKSGLPKSVFLKEKEGDPSQVIERNTSRTEYCTNRELKSGLPKSVFLKGKEGDPSQVIERNTSRTKDCANRELKSGLPNSVFLNEKEGDPPKLIKRNTLRAQPNVNIQKKRDLHTDRKVKRSRVFQGNEAHELDETYNDFFAGLKFVGDSMVYEFGDRQKILYEGGAQQISSDNDDEVEAETEAIKASPSPPTRSPEIPNSCSRPSIKTEPTFTITPSAITPTPLSPTVTSAVAPTPLSPPVAPTPISPAAHRNRDKAFNKNGKCSEEKHATLWDQLRQNLGMPFDQNEFDELWRDMTYCSEVQVYRDSRSGGTYKPGHMGKSYLEKYPELNGEIEKIKSDSCKVLNLLRMLAFYLKNVPHGIPRPWLPDYRKMFCLDPLSP